MKGALFDYWQRETFLFILRKKRKKRSFSDIDLEKTPSSIFIQKNVI